MTYCNNLILSLSDIIKVTVINFEGFRKEHNVLIIIISRYVKGVWLFLNERDTKGLLFLLNWYTKE